MKASIRAILILVFVLPLIARSQTNIRNAIIITGSNEEIKDSVRFSKGQLTSLSPSNTRKEYKPGDVKSFTIDSAKYVSYSNDFYKEIVSGGKAALYQKISNNSNEKIYNGPEPVGFLKTTEGRIGDYYILLAGETTFDLVTKKTFKEYFTKLFVDHESLLSKVKDGTLNYEQIGKSVELYNIN